MHLVVVIVLAVLNPVIATNGGANGVFIDGTNYKQINNCKYRTCGEDQSQCCVFSEEADQEYNEGLKLVRYTNDDILQFFGNLGFASIETRKQRNKS